MNFAFWVPALFFLGIAALAGFLLFLAALDSYGPTLLHWLRGRGQALGGPYFSSRPSVLKH